MEGPHWVEVEGVVLPRPFAGHPALELVNTWAGWRGSAPPERADYLRSYEHLVVFVRHLGLLDDQEAGAARRAASRSHREAESVLQQVRDLRGPARSALLDPGREAGALAPYLRRTLPHLRLQPGAPASWRIGGRALERPLHALVWSVASAVTELDPAAVHDCPGPECGWLFLDPSGRRRWCSMRSCGNRAKVAAHARRHRKP